MITLLHNDWKLASDGVKMPDLSLQSWCSPHCYRWWTVQDGSNWRPNSHLDCYWHCTGCTVTIQVTTKTQGSKDSSRGSHFPLWRPGDHLKPLLADDGEWKRLSFPPNQCEQKDAHICWWTHAACFVLTATEGTPQVDMYKCHKTSPSPPLPDTACAAPLTPTGTVLCL